MEHRIGRVPQITRSPPTPSDLESIGTGGGAARDRVISGQPTQGTTPSDLSFEDFKQIQTPSIPGLTPNLTGKPSSSSEESLNTPTNLNTPSVNLASATQSQAFNFPESDTLLTGKTVLFSWLWVGFWVLE